MRNQAIIDRFSFLHASGANETYIKHKEKVIDLLLSLNTYDETWEKVRGADAWIILTREKRMMDEIKKLKPEVYEAVDHLSREHVASL